MIAAWHAGASATPAPLEEMRRALARYDTQPHEHSSRGQALLLSGPREFIGSYGSIEVALTGWIDNATELAATLAIPANNPARIYAACLDRWGAEADRHIHGSYAAIAKLAGDTLQLSRSPWDGPPLYYHLDTQRVVASPLLRVLFAAGAPRQPDWERVVDELAYDYRSGDEAAWYHGILMVPLGAQVRIEAGQRQVNRWYEPPTPMAADAYDEETSVARALELLDEAAAKALDWAAAPALAMSGGLDSTLVCDALLRSLPEGEQLKAITFVPDKRWKGKEESGTMGDERPFARLMAQANPQLDWHVASDDVGSYDRRARDVFAACETFAPGLANVGMYHNVYEGVRDLGCDTLLTADFGNSTISDTGNAAYVEFAKQGEWGSCSACSRTALAMRGPYGAKSLPQRSYRSFLVR